MFAVLHSDINSPKSCLLHLTGQPYCKKSRSAKVEDGIINLFLRNYLVGRYTSYTHVNAAYGDQQVFGIANSILNQSDERFSLIRTYKVVPISSRLGIIECLPNITTYKSLVSSDNQQGPML